MNLLPKEIKDIINDYENDLENHMEHEKRFSSCIETINNMYFDSCEYQNYIETRSFIPSINKEIIYTVYKKQNKMTIESYYNQTRKVTVIEDISFRKLMTLDFESVCYPYKKIICVNRV